MINWARVRELRAEIGEEGFFEVVELFLDEVEEVIVRLRTAPSHGQIEGDLHFLKGSAWNLGFTEFGALCQDGERRANAGHGAGIDVGEVIECYGRSKTAFMTGLANPGAETTAA